MWENLEDGKRYVGSSENLHRRLNSYYSISSLRRQHYSYICRALLVYGYDKFSLIILEYCNPEDCKEREQYYLDLLVHEYNILPTAGSPRGYKHSKEALAKMVAAKIGNKHSEETRAKMSLSQSGKNNPMFGRAKPEGAGNLPQRIKVLNILTNESHNNQKSPYKGKYIFQKI